MAGCTMKCEDEIDDCEACSSLGDECFKCGLGKIPSSDGSSCVDAISYCEDEPINTQPGRLTTDEEGNYIC